MDIAFKLTKRQATALHKKNFAYLKMEIDDAHSDALREAEYCIDDTRDHKVILKEVTDSLKYWNKEVKEATRSFLADKERINKAALRGAK